MLLGTDWGIKYADAMERLMMNHVFAAQVIVRVGLTLIYGTLNGIGILAIISMVRIVVQPADIVFIFFVADFLLCRKWKRFLYQFSICLHDMTARTSHLKYRVTILKKYGTDSVLSSQNKNKILNLRIPSALEASVNVKRIGNRSWQALAITQMGMWINRKYHSSHGG